MKQLLAVVLVMLLAGMPAFAETQGLDESAKPPKQAWSDWKKVVKIEAGTDINLIVAGDVQVKRVFVSANDAGMVVLNLSNPALPSGVKTSLMEALSEHPDWFESVRFTIKFPSGVVIDDDGVFLSGQRVAATDEVVIRIPRDRVVEVSRPKTNVAAARIGGGVLGYFLGPIVGGIIGRVIAGMSGLVYGVLVGLVAGIWIGIWRGGKVNDNPIIYRAPAQPA